MKMYAHTHTDTHLHMYIVDDGTSGKNNQLEYASNGWLHQVNDWIQMSFS